MSVSGLLKLLNHYNNYLDPDNYPKGTDVPLRPVDFTHPNIRMNPDGVDFTDLEEGFDFGVWAETDRELVWPDSTLLDKRR